MIKKGKFELQEPYKSDWRFGYIVMNNEPRRNVILYNSPADRSTVSYAKYLYCITTGDYIPPGYVVDHIDEDQLNDTFSNFQLLTETDNIIKGRRSKELGQQMVEFRCGSCNTIFHRRRNLTHLVIKGKVSTYCSRRCSGLRVNKSVILSEYRRTNRMVGVIRYPTRLAIHVFHK